MGLYHRNKYIPQYIPGDYTFDHKTRNTLARSWDRLLSLSWQALDLDVSTAAREARRYRPPTALSPWMRSVLYQGSFYPYYAADRRYFHYDPTWYYYPRTRPFPLYHLNYPYWPWTIGGGRSGLSRSYYVRQPVYYSGSRLANALITEPVRRFSMARGHFEPDSDVMVVTHKTRKVRSYDDGPVDFSTAAAKAHRITSHTADDLDTIQSKSKRQDQALLSDISSRLYKMEFDCVKPGHDVAVMTGFRRPLYGRRHPRRDEGKARVMRMKHREQQEVDKLRTPKNYFREMKKAQSVPPDMDIPEPVVHRVRSGKKTTIEVEPIFTAGRIEGFQANPLEAYKRELAEDYKDKKRRAVADDMMLEKFISRHRELVDNDLDQQKVIDDIVGKPPRSTRTTTITKVTEDGDPYMVDNVEITRGGVGESYSTRVTEEGLDPGLKKKIKQSRDELADLEYDLTHRSPRYGLRGVGTRGRYDVMSGGSDVVEGRGSQKYSAWDDVDLYGLVDGEDAGAGVRARGYHDDGEYPGWVVRVPDQEDFLDLAEPYDTSAPHVRPYVPLGGGRGGGGGAGAGGYRPGGAGLGGGIPSYIPAPAYTPSTYSPAPSYSPTPSYGGGYPSGGGGYPSGGGGGYGGGGSPYDSYSPSRGAPRGSRASSVPVGDSLPPAERFKGTPRSWEPAKAREVPAGNFTASRPPRHVEPPVSDVRRRAREVICKTRNDPRYYDL